MGEGVAEICCKAIIATFIAAGLTALFIWVGLRGFEPTCFLHDLQLPVAGNDSVRFTLILHNRNKDTGIYYDPLHLNLSYTRPAAGPVGSAAVPGFHQGGGKDAKKNGSFVNGGGGWRREAAGFRVDLETEIRYKIVFWKTKRHRLHVGADVTVGADGGLVLKRGFLVKNKGVKLTSAAAAQALCGALLLRVTTCSLLLAGFFIHW